MASKQDQKRLVSFLNKKVFSPIMKANPKRFSEKDQKTLQELKQKTENLKKRYECYESAGQLRQEFEGDMRSRYAKKVDGQLKRLGLPTLPDYHDEFIKMADQMGVARERQTTRHHHSHPPHPWHKSKPEEKENAWR